MPKFTVLIPNYNHARYLPKRIESVLQQTVTDIEVILMDDASTDDSRAVLERYAQTDSRTRCVFNTVNSGSPFKQWNKGCKMATGDYIWIAESDDYADPTFLEKLGKVLDAHPEVGIAYSQSWKVDADGELLGDNNPYTDGLEPVRWHQDFIASGKEECAEYLIIQNTIPNASAVLLRRSVIEKVGYAIETMRLSGDHHLWVRMLLVSDLAYLSEPLNYYRIHGGSVRSDTYRNGIYLEEAYQIRQLIFASVEPRAERADFIRNDQVARWLELTVKGEGEIPWSRNIRIWQAGRQADPYLFRRLLSHFLSPYRQRLGGGLRRLGLLR